MLIVPWKAEPHNCHLDINGNPKPYVPVCHSYFIPNIIYEPMDEQLAKHIVELHNNWLKERTGVVEEL